MNSDHIIPQTNNSITENIFSLPIDLKKKIYYDNFHIKHDCDKLIEWLNNNGSLRYSAYEVEDLTNKILESKEGIEYMKKNNNFFEKYYRKHFIDNDLQFILMNNTTSLITCILMSMWH